MLSMAPGFFGFFAHIGALIALEDEGLLQEVSSCVVVHVKLCVQASLPLLSTFFPKSAAVTAAVVGILVSLFVIVGAKVGV